MIHYTCIVTIQSQRLGRSVGGDLSCERRFTFTFTFCIHVQFDEGELIIRRRR